MLNSTRAEMTGEDFSNITGAQGVQKPNFASMMGNQLARETNGPAPGIDISKLDFVSKAKGILDLANKKSSGKLS